MISLYIRRVKNKKQSSSQTLDKVKWNPFPNYGNMKNYHARDKDWKQFRYETPDHSDIILMIRETMKCYSGLSQTGILQFTQVLQVNVGIREIMKNEKNRAFWPGQRRPKSIQGA